MGIEGRCTVRYDVLGSGATTNIQALACDSAAASGVTTEIVFTLD